MDFLKEIVKEVGGEYTKLASDGVPHQVREALSEPDCD